MELFIAVVKDCGLVLFGFGMGALSVIISDELLERHRAKKKAAERVEFFRGLKKDHDRERMDPTTPDPEYPFGNWVGNAGKADTD